MEQFIKKYGTRMVPLLIKTLAASKNAKDYLIACEIADELEEAFESWLINNEGAS